MPSLMTTTFGLRELFPRHEKKFEFLLHATRKPFETSVKVREMTIGFAGQMNWQTRCILVPAVALIPCDTQIYGLDRRKGDLSAELKRDLIALLPRLRRFARSLTRSVSEADDLVQEACLRALSRSHQWDPAQPLDRWMFRITRNIWISEIRKRTVRLGQGIVPADETHELVTTETGEETVIAAELQSKIAALPEDLSAVLLTVSVEGYSYAEAAELFDIPVGTVMSRVHRARKALAIQIAEPMGASQ